LMTTSTYKGRDVFNTTAGSLYVSMGGRDQEMTFGIGEINYGALYGKGAANERTIIAATSTLDGPNKDAKFNLAHLPSDAVVAKDHGLQAGGALKTKDNDMEANKTYVVHALPAANEITYNGTTGGAGTPGNADEVAKEIFDTANVTIVRRDGSTAVVAANDMQTGDVITVGATAIAKAKFAGTGETTFAFKEVLTGENAFKAGEEYVIKGMGTSSGAVTTAGTNDASAIARAVTGISNGQTLVAGQAFTVDADATAAEMAHLNSLTEGMTFSRSTDVLTKDIETIQGLVNTARVQAGSQYAAIESAVNYTTDLTAQYELGYNTVNDVNFSMETAHLAKNQILQQAATAMLAQANQGQQGLLQLIS